MRIGFRCSCRTVSHVLRKFTAGITCLLFVVFRVKRTKAPPWDLASHKTHSGVLVDRRSEQTLGVNPEAQVQSLRPALRELRLPTNAVCGPGPRAMGGRFNVGDSVSAGSDFFRAPRKRQRRQVRKRQPAKGFRVSPHVSSPTWQPRLASPPLPPPTPIANLPVSL